MLRVLHVLHVLQATSSASSSALGSLPYVPHHLYAGHSDPPQLLELEDIQAEITRLLRIASQPDTGTAQAKQFFYFLVESASGSGKTASEREVTREPRGGREGAEAANGYRRETEHIGQMANVAAQG
jgi:hypothetical protein